MLKGMSLLVATSVVALALLVSCDSGDDDPEGVASTTATATSTSTASGAGGGGGSTDDPHAACPAYCEVWLTCTGTYADLEECMQDCVDSIDSASFAGIECFEAFQVLTACQGGLTCAELQTLGGSDGACATGSGSVSDACG